MHTQHPTSNSLKQTLQTLHLHSYMAGLEMYNSSPRISFSYDFVETHHISNTRPSPLPLAPAASSDFEFSVSNHNMVCNDMICADEIFSKGKLLPYKYSNTKPRGVGGQTTLRDELLTGQQDEISTSFVAPRPPKSYGSKWKGFWGLRRSHIGSKKLEKTDGSNQEMVTEGCSSCRDLELGM